MTRSCSSAHHATLLVSREAFEAGTVPIEGRSGFWHDIDGREHETRLCAVCDSSVTWVIDERRAA